MIYDHEHHRDGPEDCDGCRYKSLAIGKPSDFPSRTRSKTPPRTPSNSWNKGIAHDERGMPLIHSDLSEVGVKEYSERRHLIEENRRAARQGVLPNSTRG